MKKIGFPKLNSKKRLLMNLWIYRNNIFYIFDHFLNIHIKASLDYRRVHFYEH